MSGIFSGGPAIEPFRLMYMTIKQCQLDETWDLKIIGYLGHKAPQRTKM
jgi:hypothetical protein